MNALPEFFESAPNGPDHRIQNIISTDICRVDRCSCGTLHVRVRNAYFQMNPDEFVHFAAAVGFAGEPYLGHVSHRGN